MANRLFLLILLFYSATCLSQYLPSTKIKIPISNFVPEIIRSTASPDNPNNIIVSIYGWNAANRAAEVNTYSSFDGGDTFTLTLKDNSTQWVSEVSNAYGINNNCYVITGASKRTGKLRGHPYGQMHLFHSSNGGKTWENTIKSNFMDWTAAVVDASQSKYKGRLYVTAYDIANDSGNWVGPRKPLIYSSDNGISISKPLLTGKWPDDGGGYPICARVNRKGVLYILYKRDNPGGILIAKSKDGGQSLEMLPIIKKDSLITSRNIFDAGFDIDKNGILYIAYSAVHNGKPSVILAQSDDEGMSWKHKVASYYDTEDKTDLGAVSLAVNTDGTIGIFWNEPEKQEYKFIYSTTKGETFNAQVVLSNPVGFGYSNNQFLENQLQTIGTFEPDDNSIEIRSSTGLSVRFKPLSPTMSITSDCLGDFHLFWMEQQTDGSPALFTTTILPNEKKDIDKPINVNTGILSNINDRIIIDILQQQFNAGTGELTLDFTLTNKSDQTIVVPVYIELSKIITGYGFSDAKLLNKDTLYSENKRPVIDMSKLTTNGMLKTDETTSVYRISFKVKQSETTDNIWKKVQESGETIHSIICKFNVYSKKIN